MILSCSGGRQNIVLAPRWPPTQGSTLALALALRDATQAQAQAQGLTPHFVVILLRIYAFGKPKTRSAQLVSDVFGLRERAQGSKTFDLHCLWAFGKGPGAQHLVFYKVLGRRKGARGPTPCILQGFWAVGKGPGAQHPIFYKVFGPSERGQGPKTLYFKRLLAPKTDWV